MKLSTALYIYKVSEETKTPATHKWLYQEFKNDETDQSVKRIWIIA